MSGNTSTLCRLRVDLIRAGHVSSNAIRIHLGILQAINVVRSSGLSAFLIAAISAGHCGAHFYPVKSNDELNSGQCKAITRRRYSSSGASLTRHSSRRPSE